MTLVSVVVPTHDRPAYLARALESIVAQTHDEIELIVVDDASPEPVQSLVDATVGDRFVESTVIRLESNVGAAAARNVGIEAASGEIVAFLDDDDRWTPAVVTRYVTGLEAAGEAVCLIGVGARIVDETGRTIGADRPRIDGDPLAALATGSRVGSFSRFAVRRGVIEEAGPLDEQLPSWQDWEWQFRLARQCQFATDPALLVERTVGDHTQLTDDYRKRRDVSYPVMLERHRPTIAERNPRLERRFVATVTRSLAFSALASGAYVEAIRWLLRALRYDPTGLRTYLYLGMAVGGPATFGLSQRLSRRLTPLA